MLTKEVLPPREPPLSCGDDTEAACLRSRFRIGLVLCGVSLVGAVVHHALWLWSGM